MFNQAVSPSFRGRSHSRSHVRSRQPRVGASVKRMMEVEELEARSLLSVAPGAGDLDTHSVIRHEKHEFEHHTVVNVDGDGDIYFTSRFFEAVDLGAGDASLVGGTTGSVFLSKWATDGSLVSAGRIGGEGSTQLSGIDFDAENNAYFIGTLTGTVDLDPGINMAPRTRSWICGRDGACRA